MEMSIWTGVKKYQIYTEIKGECAERSPFSSLKFNQKVETDIEDHISE